VIGKPYEYGADGSGRTIDCIHLVYAVLDDLGIEAPPFQQSWYTDSRRTIVRALLAWGHRVDKPSYDGDVVLLEQHPAAFAVTWQSGLLYINQDLKAVAWCPIGNLPTRYCFRTRSSLSTLSVAPKKSTKSS
jgi:hypothetical protein